MHAELLPQPPPSVPAPPAGKAAIRSKERVLNLVAVGVVMTILFVMFVSAFPTALITMGIGGKKNANPITAINNAKQIGLALFDFELQYGKYPDATTAPLVRARSSSEWILKDATSNDLFQQLLVSGACPTEDLFYAKTPWTKKADNVFTTEAQALAAGECSFAYIAGLSAKDDPSTPVCVSPLEPGKLTFDRKSLDGKAVILFVDNSARLVPIDPTGHAILNGMDLFDPRQPFWHGKAPNVKWPK